MMGRHRNLGDDLGQISNIQYSELQEQLTSLKHQRYRCSNSAEKEEIQQEIEMIQTQLKPSLEARNRVSHALRAAINTPIQVS